MRRRIFFGKRRLYTQVVYPLVAASVAVGLIATAVAVYFLDDLTGRWVADSARNATDVLASRLDGYHTRMDREARLILAQGEVGDAIRAGDYAAASRLSIGSNDLGFDSLIVLDGAGRVVAENGASGVSTGSAPFGATVLSGASSSRCAFVTLGDRVMLVTFRAVPGELGEHVLVLTREVDDRLLGEYAVGDAQAFALYTQDGRLLATTYGSGLGGARRSALARVFRQADSGKLVAASSAGDESSPVLELDGGDEVYQAWAVESAPSDSDGMGERLVVVGAVSKELSSTAVRTTQNLIAAWSMVAVVILAALGVWIARRVSDPLEELAEGAQRIAEGDFTTKVPVRGSNEIARLAEDFNTMTDSLQERSDALTRKVLELASLYDMSRELGSTLDMDELLDTVLSSALQIFGLDRGYVTLRDRETGVVSIRAIRAESDGTPPEAVHSSMSEWVVHKGRPLIFNPDQATGDGQVDAVTGARAALCVPLTPTEGTIGSITIGSSDPEFRFSSDDVRLLSTIANHVTMAIGNIELFSSLQEAYLATVRSLAAAVDAKDSFTRGHSEYVAGYACMIAEKLGLSHEQRTALEMAAFLHDIGKIGVSEDILLKPGRLDEAETEQMRHHPLIGANILKPVAFPWAITPVVRHHHEAWDGSGYPAGLRGEEIPLLARILTVADAYEAMTADRPYRAGRSPLEAIEELRACSGGQFDPRIVDAFIEVLEQAGSDGEPLDRRADDDELVPEEARALFSSLVEGVFGSFRRLGGPRLAANVESEIDGYFRAQRLPFRFAGGRIVFESATPPTPDGEIDMMRDALRRIDATIGRLSGTTLVEHFYTDALDGLSERMRELARDLDFRNE